MLAERQDFLDQLARLAAGAAAGRGHVVFVVGEAGIGKTSLVRAFVEAAAPGLRRLWAACEDLSTPEALGPLRDLAREAGWPLAVDGEGARLALFSQALAELGARPTVAVIEDFHWADDATLDLVRYLGRRIADRPVLLVVTSRDEEADGLARLRRAMVDLPVSARSRLDLPRLSLAAVADLAGAAASPADLLAITGGNPFYLTEVIRAEGGGAGSVRDAVLARAERLSGEARKALEACSIFPRRVEARLVRGLCGGETGLAGCVAQGMLVVEGDAYAFRHEIARRAVEAELSPVRRRRLNAAALAELRATPGVSLARLAHHAGEAGDLDAVLELAPAAGEQAAAMGANREATRHYAAALAAAAGAPAPARADLMERYAFVAHLTGELGAAIQARREALTLRRETGERTLEGDGLRWLSRLSYLNGERAASDRFGAEAVALLETCPPGPELAMAYSNRAQLGMLAGDVAEAETWGLKAIALAEQVGREDILSHALNNVGTAKCWVDPEGSRAALVRSLELALAHDLPEHVARAYTNLGHVAVEAYDHARGAETLEPGIAYCIDHDLDVWRDYMRGSLARLHLDAGDWNMAAEIALQVVQNEQATPLMRNPAVVALGRLRARRGDPDLDRLIAELERHMAAGRESPRFSAYACLVAEQAWIAQAEAGRALDLIEEALAESPQGANPWQIGELWFWRRKLGGEGGLPKDQEIAAPYLDLARGDWAGAASRWEALGAPYERALALLDGDESGRREAVAALDRLGARAAAERARVELRQQGVRGVARGPRASTRTNAAGLTRREVEVLGLICEGLSNGEIGGRLFVSAKTVDHHVSAILAKLEAGSRGEAAAIARRRGLVG